MKTTRVLPTVGLLLATALLAAPAAAEEGPVEGTVVFSKEPIDPAKPEGLVTSFTAGDPIYALVRWPKRFTAQYPEKSQFMLQMLVDGEAAFYQYLEVKTDAAKALSHLVLDVAPDPAKMTAYRNPAYGWGKGKKGKLLGPHGFTWVLGGLAKGKHEVTFQDFDFGNVSFRGSFTILGDDYSPYAARHEEIQKVLDAGATMPPARKTDKDLEAKMRELLASAGWKEIRALRIIDKDWWIDRVAGGDSAVASRHLDAAVAAKADDGSFYFCICRFQQAALVTGGFGSLELAHTGEQNVLPEANLDK